MDDVALGLRDQQAQAAHPSEVVVGQADGLDLEPQRLGAGHGLGEGGGDLRLDLDLAVEGEDAQHTFARRAADPDHRLITPCNSVQERNAVYDPGGFCGGQRRRLRTAATTTHPPPSSSRWVGRRS